MPLPLLLSLIAGYADAAGFLALHGLFVAHVTGNFVTLGASLVHGLSGAAAKLLAIPVFCLVVMLTRLLSTELVARKRPALRLVLALKVVLFTVGAALAVRYGPFHDGDHWSAIVTGMVLVAAMAVQNAAHRIHLGHAPPSTLMTGTTTQIMIDLADRIRPGAMPAPPSGRILRMSVNIVVFALGCAAAAVLYAQVGVWCFVVLPVLGAIAVTLKAD